MTTRRMIVTRSSGPTSLRMNAAAPALIASNRASSSSVCGEHDDPGRGQLALDPLGRLDPAGSRQREVHEDDVGRGLEGPVDRRPAVVGLADDLEVRLAPEDVGDADPEEGVVVDDQDLRPLAVPRPIGAAAPAFRSRIAHQAGLLCSHRDREPDERAAVGPRLHLEAGADQFRALSHELEAEVAPAAGGDGSDVEPSAVVSDRQDPVVAVDRRWPTMTAEAAPCLRTFCSASCTIAQHDRLLGLVQAVGRRRRGRRLIARP